MMHFSMVPFEGSGDCFSSVQRSVRHCNYIEKDVFRSEWFTKEVISGEDSRAPLNLLFYQVPSHLP